MNYHSVANTLQLTPSTAVNQFLTDKIMMTARLWTSDFFSYIESSLDSLAVGRRILLSLVAFPEYLSPWIILPGSKLQTALHSCSLRRASSSTTTPYIHIIYFTYFIHIFHIKTSLVQKGEIIFLA